jgi:hypothetical protein
MVGSYSSDLRESWFHLAGRRIDLSKYRVTAGGRGGAAASVACNPLFLNHIELEDKTTCPSPDFAG